MNVATAWLPCEPPLAAVLDAGISVSSLVHFCLSDSSVENLQPLVQLQHPMSCSWPCLSPPLRKQQLLAHSLPAEPAPLAFLNTRSLKPFFEGHTSCDFSIFATNLYLWSYLANLLLKYNCPCVVLPPTFADLPVNPVTFSSATQLLPPSACKANPHQAQTKGSHLSLPRQ